MEQDGGSERIFFSCGGLGMGNASRIAAVLESLVEQAGLSVSLHVCSWGPGYEFLKSFRRHNKIEFHLTEIHAYPATHSVEGAISPVRFLSYLVTFIKNVRVLKAVIRQARPTLIVLDSDYHFPAYFFSRRPIVFIGQAHDVLDRAKSHRFRSRSWLERANLFLREKMDAAVQTWFANQVLVPSFTGAGSHAGNVSKIPLITRKEFQTESGGEVPSISFGALLSGSGIEKEDFFKLAELGHLEIVNPIPSSATTLDHFDVVFTQGGLSSISECIARRKFLVVFPMQRHPEQILNALEVERLGLGMRASREELQSLPGLMARIATIRANRVPHEILCDGATIAAQIILKVGGFERLRS